MSVPHGRILASRIVGPHRIELETPDVVHVHYGGDVELAHFLAFDEIITAFPGSMPLYLLRNARYGGVLAAETRRHIGLVRDASRFAATATYGASFQSKTVFSNMHRALRTVRGNGGYPFAFFNTEAEARAWLEQWRSLQDPA